MTNPRRSCHKALLSLCLWQILLHTVLGAIGKDGKCAIFVFVPFTIDGETPGADFSYDNLNVGFSHMAAALMAAKHFNERDSTIVPQLAVATDGCNVTLDVSRVFDTESVTHKAARDVYRHDDTTSARPPLCALVGGWTGMPASDLAVAAHAREIPLVAHRAENVRVSDTRTSPFASLVYPDLLTEVSVAVEYLRFIGRTDFVALLYAQTESGVQKREGWGSLLNSQDMSWTSSGFQSSFKGKDVPLRDVFGALQHIQWSGYRTVVLIVENAVEEIPVIADAAEELGMNTGEYLFFVSAFTSGEVFQWNNSNVTNLLHGAVAILPTSLDPNQASEEEDVFKQSWSTDLSGMSDVVIAKNPIGKSEPGYVEVDDTTFQSVPSFGSRFMYDAVMAVGIGACGAQGNGGEYITGHDHLHGIHQVNFSGATGRLAFRNVPGRSGSRLATTLSWGTWNFQPIVESNTTSDTLGYASLVAVKSSKGGTWRVVRPSTYRDGREVPPDLLRDMPNQNYLTDSLRVVGFVFMGIVISMAIALAVWVSINRTRRVVTAAQPFFLYLICLGSAIEASCVWIISFDESRGWSEDRLSAMCAAAPWYYVVGHSLVYGSLATKLYRVHRVLQFSRRQVKVQHVIGPMVGLLIIALSILLIWTLVDPLYWNRGPGDPITGESFGSCQTHSLKIFAPLEMFVLAIPTIMTAWMAWRTRDVDEVYTESWWIFVMILIQIELVIMAAPVIVILSDVSTDGRYLGICAMIVGFPFSTLLLIFGPKIYADYKERNADVIDRSPSKRGSHQGVRISGIPGSGAPPGLQGNSSEDPRNDSPRLVASSPATSKENASSRTSSGLAGSHMGPVIKEDAAQSDVEPKPRDSSLAGSSLAENGVTGDDQ